MSATKLDAAAVANPTGVVGLAAVNGSAATWMRSDAAPALSQAIVPTWTGIHTFSAKPAFNAGAAVAGAALTVTSVNTTFSATSGASLVLNNATAGAIQTPLDFQLNGTICGRIRNDSSGSLNYVGTSSGSHFFWVGGDFGVGATTFKILSAASGGAQVADTNSALQPVGFRNIPLDNKAVNYTLVAADVGRCIGLANINLTVNNGVFSAGDVVMLAIAQGSTATIVQGAGVSLQWVGTTGTTGNRTFTGAGVATLYFASSSLVLISGGGLT